MGRPVNEQQLLSVWVVDTAEDSAAGTRFGAAVAVVRVCGEVDQSTAPILAETLDRVLTPKPGRAARSVVVDCSAMTFCSGRGLDVLHAAAARAAAGDVGYAIAGMSAHLIRVAAAIWPAPGPTHYPRVAEAILAVRADRAPTRLSRPA